LLRLGRFERSGFKLVGLKPLTPSRELDVTPFIGPGAMRVGGHAAAA